MNERRHSRRHQLLFHATVYDADSGRALGLLRDLSADGLMIAGDQPLRVGREYRLRIDLPITVCGEQTLRTRSTVVWSRPAHLGYCHAGLSARGLDDGQACVLATLIDEYELRFAE